MFIFDINDHDFYVIYLAPLDEKKGNRKVIVTTRQTQLTISV